MRMCPDSPREAILFDSVAEPFAGPKPKAMPLFEYLSRSDQSRNSVFRSYWNDVFRNCDLSAEVKGEIRKRFRSKVLHNHVGALTELIVYELFKRAGYAVEAVQPKSRMQPDFEVHRAQGTSFYIEATCILGRTKLSEEERFRLELFEAVRSIRSESFRVCLSIRGNVCGEFDQRCLKQRIEHWLDNLDYGAALVERGNLNRQWDFVEQIGNGCLVLHPVPMQTPADSLDNGLVMLANLHRVELDITDKRLRRKLRGDKAKQLREQRLPVLLVVNVFGGDIDDDVLLSAFMGDPAVDADRKAGIESDSGLSVREGGVWYASRKRINKSIQAVLLLRGVDHGAFPTKQPIVVLNPFVDEIRVPTNLQFARYVIPAQNGSSMRAYHEECEASSGRGPGEWQSLWPLPPLQ